MSLAAVLLFAVPALLAVSGIALIAVGVVDVNRAEVPARRNAGILRIIGGAGALLIAALSVYGTFGAGIAYAIAFLPLAALVLGAVWIAAWTIAATVVAARR
ncbi:hypothetical protein [Microbacterium invictum]|uniref:Uncharacterized protein n=1 Tax=Microbacterium invictum TaxID=515415 RepID=A0AA40SLA6_9MICO|nr:MULTISPECIES: hypothetical protein [Microbacterium]MBB4138313.1 hypothetical protein [Microbacterium invictum]